MTAFSAVMLFLLAAVLAYAAVGKIRRFQTAVAGTISFGVPVRAAPSVTGAVVVAEATAAVLLCTDLFKAGAVLALTLLLTFTIAAAVALARGKAPACSCFGQASPRKIDGTLFIRNIVLIAWAAWLVSPAASKPVASLGALPHGTATQAQLTVAVTVLSIALLAAVGLAAWVIAGLTAATGRLLVRIEALETAAGTSRPEHLPGLLPEPVLAPEFQLPGVNEGLWSLEDLRSEGTPLLLLFTDTDCRTCGELLPQALAADAEGMLGVPLAVISRQPVNYPRFRSANSESVAARHILVDSDGVVTASYGVRGVPSAVLLDADGRIHHDVAAGPAAISALLTAHREHPPHSSPSQAIDSPSSDARLPLVDPFIEPSAPASSLPPRTRAGRP
jgi:peroxiredoxin